MAAGLLSLAWPQAPRKAAGIAVSGLVLGALFSIGPVLRLLGGGPTETLTRPWSVPYAEFAVRLDPLAAWFLAPLPG